MNSEGNAHSNTPRRGKGRLVAVVVGALLVAVGFALGLVSERVGGTTDSQPAPSAVDIGFLQDMSVHHHQATEMSAAILTTTEDAEVRNLAFDILTGQENQIGQMHGWLQIWDEPLLPLNGFMGWMDPDDQDHAGHMDHSEPMGQMPGMASPAEMAQLRAAQGTERDVLFLQLMLRHHDGGIPMMEYAIEHAEVPVVRNIASSMLDGQTKEIGLITMMLDQRGAEPLPMN